MSYIQLPYGYVNEQKQIQFNLPSNYKESFYLDKVPYLTTKNPMVENNLINLIKNRDDLKRWLLATGDYGAEIQENLNAVVGHDEKFTNSIIRHALDLKDDAIFRNPNPLNVTFYDMKKFDQVNPVIGKLAAQVKASKLTEQGVNQKLLDNFEADQLQARLDELRYGDPDDSDDDDNKKGPGGTLGGTPVNVSPLDDDEELQRRLDRLRGNVVVNSKQQQQNTPDQNSELIAQQNSENFFNRQLKQREKELTGLRKGAKGNVGKKRSSIEPSLKFRLPETPPPSFDEYWDEVADQWIPHKTPLSGPPEPPLFDYDRDFPPLNRSIQRSHLPPMTPKTPLPPILPSTPREPSFSSPAEASVSPLRKKLPSIDPFPSLPNINDFSRPITDVVDEKNNRIMITPKKAPLPPIGQKQLSQELNKIFPDVDNTFKEKADTFKERTLDINELFEKVGRDEKSEATFEFEFFSGGKNSKFDSFVKKFGLTTENINFIDFLQSEYCKEILQNNDLKIHIETGNIYYDDKDTNESISEFIQNQQNTSKGIIRYDFKFVRNFRDYC